MTYQNIFDSQNIIPILTNKKTKKKNLQSEINFQPTIQSLVRIITAISENQSLGKTNLSHFTNLNYDRLSQHISWLEQKGFIQSVINKGKVHFVVTPDGRNFAEIISS